VSSALLVEPLVGVQSPRVCSLPPGLPDKAGDFGDRAVQLADLAGLRLDPWQQLVLRVMLRRSDGGRWAAFESCLLVPRQNGKSVILEAFDLAKLFLSPPGHLILHTAHLFPTAMESYRHLTGLVRNTPELWSEVARVSKAHGEEGLELQNGSRLRFAARTVTGAGRGFSPDDVVLDEAFKLPHEALSAMLPALSAKPDPQIVYASSTGYPDSEILWSLVERGRASGDASLAFLEWSADPALDLGDEDQLWLGVAQANPALGYRLTERKIAAEMASMRSEDRDRERLGLWADTRFQAVIDMDAWAALEDPESGPADPYGVVFAVDMAFDRSSASIASSSARKDGAQHVEVVDNRPGIGWVVARVAELVDRWAPSAVILDAGGPAGALLAALTEAGVETVNPSAREVGQAAGMFYDGVAEATFKHRPDETLDLALKGAKKRRLGDVWTWDRRDLSDISPLVAVTLALWGHAVHGRSATPNIW
jgi:hypothetical protein